MMASPTLQATLREVDEHRWRGMRSRARNYSQAQIGIDTLEDILRVPPFTVSRIAKDHVRTAVRIWLAAGTRESTIVARLNCLSCLGIDVTGCRPRVPRKLKWWLSPEDELRITAHCRESAKPIMHKLADLIEWTTRTGLRIEESIALKWSDVYFRPGRTLVTVPGLKTYTAQKTLPVSDEAGAILTRRKALGGKTVFDVAYNELQRAWKEARDILGLTDPYSATLKALRRSAARSLHVSKGMPLDMVRQYLRHENVDTTMGYLRLTGGYGEEEIGKWL